MSAPLTKPARRPTKAAALVSETVSMNLADSIRAHGIQQELVVTPIADSTDYRVVIGHRRLAASFLVIRVWCFPEPPLLCWLAVMRWRPRREMAGNRTRKF